jgi:hypothetical protein
MTNLTENSRALVWTRCKKLFGSFAAHSGIEKDTFWILNDLKNQANYVISCVTTTCKQIVFVLHLLSYVIVIRAQCPTSHFRGVKAWQVAIRPQATVPHHPPRRIRLSLATVR